MRCDTEISKQSEWISCINGDWGRAAWHRQNVIDEFKSSPLASLNEEDTEEFAIISIYKYATVASYILGI